MYAKPFITLNYLLLPGFIFLLNLSAEERPKNILMLSVKDKLAKHIPDSYAPYVPGESAFDPDNWTFINKKLEKLFLAIDKGAK